MERFHHSVAPCENWGKPHKCYACACALAAHMDETNKMALVLQDNGIECTIEQTGGLTMVGYIFSEDKTNWISFTNEGMGWCKGNYEEGTNDEHFSFKADYLEDNYPKNGLKKKHLKMFLKTIQENLFRIGK
jgi:hypothetical protein